MSESLFTTQLPINPNVSEGSATTLAGTFTFAVDGTVSGIRFLAPSSVSGTFDGVLYEITTDDSGGTGAGTVLGTATFSALSPGNWNVATFATPIAVTAAKTYRAAVRTSAGRYTATNNAFNGTSIVNGNVTGVQSNSLIPGHGTFLNGTFTGDVTSYPVTSFQSTNYFVDVVFDAAGAGVTTVTSDLDIRWRVDTTVTSDLDIRWASGGVVTSDLSLSWRVLTDSPVVTDGVDYDLNDIADAIAATFQGLSLWTVDTDVIPLTVYSEVPGVANVPALAIELDDVTYDVTMGRGADSFAFLAYVLVASADSPDAQRLIRRVLSSRGLYARLKDALEANQTLGGLVSYAIMTGTRSIGAVNYGGLDYQGATIEITVMS